MISRSPTTVVDEGFGVRVLSLETREAKDLSGLGALGLVDEVDTRICGGGWLWSMGLWCPALR